MSAQVKFLNPQGMHVNPAFSQAAVVSGEVRTVYVGGQNAVNARGEIVGVGDLGVQAAQIFDNLETALKAAGAGLSHIVKWSVYVCEGQSPEPAFAVFQQRWAGRADPPLITVLYVSALAHPDFLMEIEATAVLPCD